MSPLPDDQDPLNQGARLLSQGLTDEAIAQFKASLARNRYLPQTHFNLALAYMQKSETVRAIDHLRQVIDLSPTDYEAFNLLGHLLMTVGNIEAAISCFDKAVQLNPMLVEGYYNLGVAYMNQGRFQDAIRFYKQSLRLFPGNSIVENNLGVTYQKLGDDKQAARHFLKALKLNPTNAQAHVNLGSLYLNHNPFTAGKYFAKALALDPDLETAHYNLGVCLRIIGDVEGSIQQLSISLSQDPDFYPTYGQLLHQLREACQWQRCQELHTQMQSLEPVDRHGLTAHTPFTSVVYDPDPQRNLEVARIWSQAAAAKVAQFKDTFQHRKRGARLRVGYLSNDFRDHATTHLITGLIRAHDKKHFEIKLYSYGPNDTSRYKKQLLEFAPCTELGSISDLEAAAEIAADKLDVLVDLKGHTSGARLEILAQRPAPVQVHLLGFPGSTGADFIDYIVVDRVLVPPGEEAMMSEQCVVMPHSYQPTDNLQPIRDHRISLEKMLVDASGPVMACFNHPYKITPEVFDIWLEALRLHPEATLCLLATNNTQIDSLTNYATQQGITLSQLKFLPKMKKSYHLARLALFDLCLDTTPCNGMTTTTDALYAGVPVLTTHGTHIASRVSTSLVTAVGMSELSVSNLSAYRKKLLRLLDHPYELTALKHWLIDSKATASLFDTTGYTKALEEGYRQIVARYRSGLAPTRIEVRA